jgi:hypothetical protein
MVASHGGSPSGRWLVDGRGPEDVPGRLLMLPSAVTPATDDEPVLVLAVRLGVGFPTRATPAPALRPVEPFLADFDF